MPSEHLILHEKPMPVEIDSIVNWKNIGFTARGLLGFDQTEPYTEEDLNKAYRARACIVHPDKNAHYKATQAMQALNHAKEYLLHALHKTDVPIDHNPFYAPNMDPVTDDNGVSEYSEILTKLDQGNITFDAVSEYLKGLIKKNPALVSRYVLDKYGFKISVLYLAARLQCTSFFEWLITHYRPNPMFCPEDSGLLPFDIILATQNPRIMEATRTMLGERFGRAMYKRLEFSSCRLCLKYIVQHNDISDPALEDLANTNQFLIFVLLELNRLTEKMTAKLPQAIFHAPGLYLRLNQEQKCNLHCIVALLSQSSSIVWKTIPFEQLSPKTISALNWVQPGLYSYMVLHRPLTGTLPSLSVQGYWRPSAILYSRMSDPRIFTVALAATVFIAATWALSMMLFAAQMDVTNHIAIAIGVAILFCATIVSLYCMINTYIEKKEITKEAFRFFSPTQKSIPQVRIADASEPEILPKASLAVPAS